MDTIEEEQDSKEKGAKAQVIKQEHVNKDEANKTKVIREIIEEMTETTYIYKEISVGHSDQAGIDSGKDNAENKNKQINQSVKNKSDELEEMKKIINQEIEKDKQEKGKILLEFGGSVKEIKVNVENVLKKNPNIIELGKAKGKEQEENSKPKEHVFLFKKDKEEEINSDTKQNAEKEKLERKELNPFEEKGTQNVMHEYIYKTKDENKEDLEQKSKEKKTIEKSKSNGKLKVIEFIYNKDNGSEESTEDKDVGQNIDKQESEIKSEEKTELEKMKDEKVLFSKKDGMEEMRKIITQEIQKENVDERKLLLDLSWEIIQVAVGNSGHTAKVFRDSIYDSERELKNVMDVDIVEEKEKEIEVMRRIINQGNTKGKGKILIDIENITDEKENSDTPIKISDKIKEKIDKEKKREDKAREHEDINKEIDEIRTIINQGNVTESDKGRILIDLEKIKKEILTENKESKELSEEEIKRKDVEKPKRQGSVIETILSSKEKEMKKWKLKAKVDEKFKKDEKEISRKNKDEEINKSSRENVEIDEKETKEIEKVKENEEKVEILGKENDNNEVEVCKKPEEILRDEKDNEKIRNENVENIRDEKEIDPAKDMEEVEGVEENNASKDKIEKDQANENILGAEKDNINMAKDDNSGNTELFKAQVIKNIMRDEKEIEDVFKDYNKLIKNETYEKVEVNISGKENEGKTDCLQSVDIIEESTERKVEEGASDKVENLILINELKEEEKEFEGIAKIDEEETVKNEIGEMKKIINQEKDNEKVETIPGKDEEKKSDCSQLDETIEENKTVKIEEEVSNSNFDNLVLIMEPKEEEEKEYEGICSDMDKKEMPKNEIEEMKKIINQEKLEDISKEKETEKIDNQSINKHDSVNILSNDVQQCSSKVNKSDTALEDNYTEIDLRNDNEGVNIEQNVVDFNYGNKNDLHADERSDEIDLDFDNIDMDTFGDLNILDTKGDDVFQVLMDSENQGDDAIVGTAIMGSNIPRGNIDMNRKKVYEFKYENEDENLRNEISGKNKIIATETAESNLLGKEEECGLPKNIITEQDSSNNDGSNIKIVNDTSPEDKNLNVTVATVHAESPTTVDEENKINEARLHLDKDSDNPDVKMDIKKSRSFDAGWLSGEKDDVFKVLQTDFFERHKKKNYLDPLDIVEPCDIVKKTRKSVSFDASFLEIIPKEEQTDANESEIKSDFKETVLSQEHDLHSNINLNYEGEDILEVLATGCDSNPQESEKKKIDANEKLDNVSEKKNFDVNKKLDTDPEKKKFDAYEKLDNVPVPPLRKKRSPSVPILNSYNENKISFDNVKLVYSNSELEIIPPPRRKLLERKQRFMSQEKTIQKHIIMNSTCKSYSLSDINAYDSDDIDFFNDVSEIKLATSFDDSILPSSAHKTDDDAVLAYRSPYTSYDDSVLPSSNSRDVNFASPETSDLDVNPYSDEIRASVALVEMRKSLGHGGRTFPPKKNFVNKKSHTFTKGDTYLNEFRDSVRLKKKSKSVGSRIRRTFSLKELSKSHDENPPCLPNLFKKYRKRKKECQCDLKNLPPISEEIDFQRSTTSESFKSIFIGDEVSDPSYVERCIGSERNMSCVSLTFPDLPEAYLRKSSSSIDVSQYASNSELKSSAPPRRGSATCLSKALMLRRLKGISHESSVASLDSHTLKRAKDLLDKSLGTKSNEEPSLANLTDTPELKKGQLPRFREFGQRNNNPTREVLTLKEKYVFNNSQELKTNESENSKSSEPSSKFSMPNYLRMKFKNRSASLDVQSLYSSKELWNKSLDEQTSEHNNDTPIPPKRSKSKQSINSDSQTDLDNIDSLDEEIQPRKSSFAKPKNILKLLHEKHSSTESFKSIFTAFNTAEKEEKQSKENILSSIFDSQDKKSKRNEDKEVISKKLSESEMAQKKRLDYLKNENKNLEKISHKIHDIHDAQEEFHGKVMRSFIRRYSHDIEALNESDGKLKELTNMYQVNFEKNEEEMEKVASKEILGLDNINNISINKLNLLDAGKRRESLGLIASLPSLKEGESSVRFSSEDDNNSDSDEGEKENKPWEVYKYPCKTAPDFVNKENLIKECLDGTFRLKLQNYVKGFKPKVDSSLPDLPEEDDNISTDSTEILADKYERKLLRHLKIKSNDSENYDKPDVEYIKRFARKYELDLFTLFEIKGKNFLKLADTEIAQRRASVYNFRTMSDSDIQVRSFDMDNVKTNTDFYNIDPSLSERGYLELSPEILHSVNGTTFTPKETNENHKNNEFKIKKKVSIAEPVISYSREEMFSSCDEETEPESDDDDVDESTVDESFENNKDQTNFDKLHAPAYRSLSSYETENEEPISFEEKGSAFHSIPSKLSHDFEQNDSFQNETNDSSEIGSIKSNSTNIDTLGKEYEDEVLSQVNNIIPHIENRLKNISKFSYLNMKTNEHGLIENPRLFKSTKLTKTYSEDFPRTVLPKYPLKKRTSLDSSKMRINGFPATSGQIPDWFRFQPLSLTKLASNVLFRNRKMEMFSKMMDTSESINKFILSNNSFGDKIKKLLLSNSDFPGFEEPPSPVKHNRLGPSIQHLVVARRDSTITYESSRPDSPIPEDVDPNCELQFHETLCLTRSPKQPKENIYHFPYLNEDNSPGTDTIDGPLNANDSLKNVYFNYEDTKRANNKIVSNPLTNRQFITSPVQDEETFSFEDIQETGETEELETKEVSDSQYSSDYIPQHFSCKSMHRTNAFDDGSSSSLNSRESFNGDVNASGVVQNRDIIESDNSNQTNETFLIKENSVPDHIFRPVNEPDIIFNESSDSSECLSSDDDTQTVRHMSDITNTIKDKCSLNCECQFPSDDSDPVKILALHAKPGSPEYELRTWFERQDTPEELKTPSPVSIPKWVKDEDLPVGSDIKSRKDTPSPGPPSEKSGKLSSQSSTEGEKNSKKEDDRTQKDRCIEIYPETIRQRQRNMAPSPSKVDIKNWEPSTESPEDEKKFLPSVKALRNQFENGKAKPTNNNNTLVRTSSDSSTNSLVLNSLDMSSGFGSLTSSQVTLEQTSSGPMPSPIEEDEAVEPIFNQFGAADDELKEMMSKPPSTQGWNPHPLLKRLYYVPDAPKIHRREAPFVNIEGYLEKLPSGRKKATFWNAWKRRYFVAKDGILFYYQSNQTDKPNMKLPLMGGKIEIMDPSMISVEDGQGRESRNAGMLGIDDGKGHYVVVRCTSRQEAERWKEALETHTLDDFSSHYVQPWPRPTNPTLLRDTLVIDIGSCSVRAGVLASQPTLPQLFFPSVVATNRETKSQIWGFEALMPDVRPTSSIAFPIRPSHKISKFSVDLNAVSSLLQKTFNDLKVDPKNYNIQLSVPRVLNPHTQAELLKILFDKFGVKAVNMTHQSILALYAYNATSGIIVDVGERLDVVPVIDGYIVDGGVSRVPYGGYRIMDHLRQFLFQKNISLLNEIDSYVIRQILENICYCAQHYNTEKQRCTMNPENFEKDAPLADFFPQEPQFDAFRELSLDFGRFQATEGLFNPDAWGLDHPGLHKLVHKAIQECSMDIRKELSRSIFLVGGVSLMPGLADRLTAELDNLTPPAIRPKVHASPYRYHASYLGACILAESDAFAQSKITKEEWIKQGNSALRKWAL